LASTIKVTNIDTPDNTGNITVDRPLSGSGASLTNLPAANLTGTIAAISGANLTNLNATNLASGTVPTARLGSGTANSGVFLRGDGTWDTAGSTSASDLTSGTLPDARFPATLPAASGVNLTALNATNLGSGTVPDARLGGDKVCKAWINFNGIGTVAIRDSLNVSSLTDLNTGFWRVTYSSALADTNYSAFFSAKEGSSGAEGDINRFAGFKRVTASASYIDVSCQSGGTTPTDPEVMCVAVFGG